MADRSAGSGEHLIELDELARRGQPPVAGAQWDEVHGCWEAWDEAADSWFVLTDGARVPRPVARVRPELLSIEVVEPEPEEPDAPLIVDLDRLAEPTEHVPGAQWNEVAGRWERWDESAEAWVEARA